VTTETLDDLAEAESDLHLPDLSCCHEGDLDARPTPSEDELALAHLDAYDEHAQRAWQEWQDTADPTGRARAYTREPADSRLRRPVRPHLGLPAHARLTGRENPHEPLRGQPAAPDRHLRDRFLTRARPSVSDTAPRSV
jgi:hypothetical protein